MTAESVIAIATPVCGGSIQAISTTQTTATLRLVPEAFTEHTDNKSHKQWFYFSVSNVEGKDIRIEIVDAGESSFSPAWQGYTVVSSYDEKDWFRVPDTYFTRRKTEEGSPCGYSLKKGTLGWAMKATQNTIYFAYFIPFPLAREAQMVHRISQADGVKTRTIGQSLDGRDIQVIEMGSGPANVWVAARQHPGETQASFFMEGFLERMVDTSDSDVVALLQAATLHIVPNMNPDGSARGNLRTNATGANLNREWCAKGSYAAPSKERSPEVLCVLAECDRIGCDFYLDVHGDEECVANFLADAAGIPDFSERLGALNNMFQRAFVAASDDFQVGQGYEPDAPGQANMSVCSHQMSARFDTVAITLEMPYKDYLTAEKTDSNCYTTHSHTRCRALGERSVNAILSTVPFLRGDEYKKAAADQTCAFDIGDTSTRLNALENMRLVLDNAKKQTASPTMITCGVEAAAALLYEWLEDSAPDKKVHLEALQQRRVAGFGYDKVTFAGAEDVVTAAVFVEAHMTSCAVFAAVAPAVAKLYAAYGVNPYQGLTSDEE